MVMTNLDSEVKELSSSTVDTMKQCMAKVSTSKHNSYYCMYSVLCVICMWTHMVSICLIIIHF